MKLLIALTLGACVLSSATFAQDAKPKKEAKVADPNKKVCREEEETGSRFTKRVCHTATEWAQIQAENSNAITDAMRHNRSGAQ